MVLMAPMGQIGPLGLMRPLGSVMPLDMKATQGLMEPLNPVEPLDTMRSLGPSWNHCRPSNGTTRPNEPNGSNRNTELGTMEPLVLMDPPGPKEQLGLTVHRVQ